MGCWRNELGVTFSTAHMPRCENDGHLNPRSGITKLISGTLQLARLRQANIALGTVGKTCCLEKYRRL